MTTEHKPPLAPSRAIERQETSPEAQRARETTEKGAALGRVPPAAWSLKRPKNPPRPCHTRVGTRH